MREAGAKTRHDVGTVHGVDILCKNVNRPRLFQCV